jgi:serine/threonine-protein kinase
MIGEVLGSYQIIRKLGEGAMGEVYYAEHQFMERRAAVKVLRPELCANRDVINRFFAEAKAADLMKHPGIVQVYDCGVRDGGRAFIVMEFLEGETLGARLEREAQIQDVATILRIASQVAEALQAAHAHGIIHRDLKPDNVFLATEQPGGRVRAKVLDFGVAKLRIPGQVAATQTGSIVGTPLYMSPEQARGAEKVDQRADVYSLGCIVFEMACGRPPFIRAGVGDLIIAHVSEAPPVPSRIRPALPMEIDELIAKMMAKKPDDRPQSMGEVVVLLERYRSRSSIAAGASPLQDPPPSRPSLAPKIGPPPAISGVQAGRTHLLPDSTLGSGSGERIPIFQDSSAPHPNRRRGRGPIVAAALASLALGGGITALIFVKGATPAAAVSGTVTAGPERLPEPGSSNLQPASPRIASAPPPVAVPIPLLPVRVESRTGHRALATRHHRRAEPEATPPTSVPAPEADAPTAADLVRSGTRAFDRGNFVQATIAAKRAIRQGAGADAYVLLGDSLLRVGQHREALNAYEGGLRIDPRNEAATTGRDRAKLMIEREHDSP